MGSSIVHCGFNFWKVLLGKNPNVFQSGEVNKTWLLGYPGTVFVDDKRHSSVYFLASQIKDEIHKMQNPQNIMLCEKVS